MIEENTQKLSTRNRNGSCSFCVNCISHTEIIEETKEIIDSISEMTKNEIERERKSDGLGEIDGRTEKETLRSKRKIDR